MAALILTALERRLGVPAQVTAWVTGLELSPVSLVVFLILFYLLLGTFMEACP